MLKPAMSAALVAMLALTATPTVAHMAQGQGMQGQMMQGQTMQGQGMQGQGMQGQGMRGQGKMAGDCSWGDYGKRGGQMMGMGPGYMMGPGAMMGMGSGYMMGPGAMMGQGYMMGRGSMMGGPGGYIEGRIAFLKTELGITSNQEQAWRSFADAMRNSAQSMQAMHNQMMSGDGVPETLPERMQWHETFMAARLEQLKSLREAMGPLYNELTPDQKQKADSLMMGMM